ncbi:M16 family metallopeptidase [Gulosibacter molinativorax]|uniref:Insulinase family protein n=1 Tax=Gulosibacter molinativorax TaxID=256821 RepID=A0ABT7C3J7_9MICO|nr:pitrilysin family protein [Gulosibacter molinativorax]MDJ1369833.1 insulinase family protein [Gulosibacter molinativorax]QUY61798.1 Putative metallopeptidase, M16 family [Gulosibacter molinativorax]
MTTPIQLPLDLPYLEEEVAGGATLRRTILPSGVRLITEDVPGAASAAIGFFVPLGSRDETNREYGSSHFLEHLLFKGTPTRSARDVALEFERVGGDFNAATSREQTVYHARVRDRDLGMAIDVLTDMITSSLLEPAEFELERGVILEEIAMAEDDPTDVLWEKFYENFFGAHPLGRPIAGTPDSILAVSRDEVWDFYRRYYRPDQLVISIAGRVDHEDALRRVEAGLRKGGWDLDVSASPVARRDAAPAQYDRAERIQVIERELEQTHLIVGSRGIDARDDRRTTFGLLHHILGGGMSSRLFQEVREKRGLVYSVFSFGASHADAGVTGVSASFLPNKAAEAVRVIRDELDKIATDGVTEEELADAQGAGAGAGALALESMNARMHRLARAELVLGEYIDLDASIARMQATTLEDILALSREVMTGDKTVETIGPLTTEAKTELEAL